MPFLFLSKEREERCQLSLQKAVKHLQITYYLIFIKKAEVFKALSSEEQEIVMVLEKLARKLKGDD